MTTSWIFFSLAITVAFIIDLIAHKDNKKPSIKSAFLWTLFWIIISLGFNVWIYLTYGSVSALNFLTGYLVEKALSIDNLFVFLIIFEIFKIPQNLRHKVLFWGVLGAIIMRALFIAVGIELVETFNFIFYVFGLFLIYTGIKLAFQKEEEIHPEKNWFIKTVEKWIPLDCSENTKFFVRKNNKLYATSLFLALLTVEFSDLVFAIDSIPAILGITQDPFIVYTSNIFAILGLRSLYFTLEKTLDLFHYLHYGLACILVFIGVKMLIADFYHISIMGSLTFIAAMLIISIAASLINPKP